MPTSKSINYDTEAKLLAGVAGGDRLALADLYKHLYKSSFASAQKLMRTYGGRSEDAEDVFQEAFIRLHKKIHDKSYQHRAGVKVSTFFYEIMKYLWNDELKSARKRRVEGGESLANLSKSEKKEADSDFIKNERAAILRKQIEELGQKCAEVLRLFMWENWSLESIADKMSITPESAKNQKYRCMKRLKTNYLKKIKH